MVAKRTRRYMLKDESSEDYVLRIWPDTWIEREKPKKWVVRTRMPNGSAEVIGVGRTKVMAWDEAFVNLEDDRQEQAERAFSIGQGDS